jgi:hypothetical protein
VGFYRWHVPDPLMFSTELRATIQQIGAAMFLEGQDADFADFAAQHPVAGRGWWRVPGLLAGGIAERVDDYCATAYVYAQRPQAVPRVDPTLAVTDVQRRPWEQPSPMELLLSMAGEPEVFLPRASR